jgi:hypothetical protein
MSLPLLGLDWKMENSKSPNVGFWFSVATSLLVLYVAAYGFLRWQDALIHDVRIWTAANGVSYSGIGVRDNPYVDDREPWHAWVGPPAESVFFPLCEIETTIRLKLRQSGWHDPSLD